jgi:UDP-glucose 4-epimerase
VEELSGRRILVTGGSGFIGRHVVSGLTASGARVRVLDLRPHPRPDVDIVVGDLTDEDVVAAAFDGGIDAIVHLAALTSVLRSVERPELTYRTNVAATAALLEAARTGAVRTMVFASTNAVVGVTDGAAIDESTPLQPLTPYGASKAASEMLMSAYTASYGIRCACLRLTNVYGPGMEEKDSIVARLMRTARTGATFEIYGDGLQVRDYVHVSDVIDAVTRGLDDEAWSGPMVIGNGTSLSVLDVIEAVRQVSRASLAVRHGPARAAEMRAVAVDISRSRAAGWSPRLTLGEGLVGVWDEWSRTESEASRREVAR